MKSFFKIFFFFYSVIAFTQFNGISGFSIPGEIDELDETSRETLEITVCDEDYDGLASFDFSGIRSQLQATVDDTGIQRDEVYIANSYSGLIKIENVSTQPNRVNVCNSSFTLYEVAVDQSQQIYVSGQSGIFKVNTNNCTYQNVGNLPARSNIAMSFDTQNNLYVGGLNHSRVYRANAGQFNDFYVWHDFGSGSSGGDFVVIDDHMYIAWAYNHDYFLFKITLDADNQYVSHENLGPIPTDTFGMAAENGRLYGVTPNYLYHIDLETMQTSQIIVNSGSSPWWGAAGLHEAVSFQISFHANLNDAESGNNDLGLEYSNTTPFLQTIYIRVLNEITGEYEIYNLVLNVQTPVQVEDATLYQCVPTGQQTTTFDLTTALPQMLDSTENINVSYFSSLQNAENATNAITNITAYQPASLPTTIYVRFENPCVSFGRIVLSGETAEIHLPPSYYICEGESVTISVDDTFDSYSWSGLMGLDIANNNANSNEITVTQPGIYIITATYGENCTTTRQVEVVQELRPEFANQILHFCSEENNIEMGVNELIANLQQINSSYSYSLFHTAEAAAAGSAPLSGNLNLLHEQNLAIRVTNSANSNCYTIANLEINLQEIPEIDLEENYNICPGESLSLLLFAGWDSYVWNGLSAQDQNSNNINSNSVIISESGIYSVEVSSGNCSAVHHFSVNYEEAAIIHNIEITGNTVWIDASGPGSLEYSIDGINWFSQPRFSQIENGIYTAYVRGDEVCGISEKSFSLFEISNIITPNRDGYNDTWEIKGISAYPDTQVKIFNRYGKLILDKKVTSDTIWDGTYNGQIVPSASYWYIIEVEDGRKFTGSITVKNF
ncbi:MAG: T9SS type B sorting domain-containing protein [Flavobacteriaceae bacterium]|nr:T9SS type B sorting domain-containing protein [Flavobacteriaceae bacterium]